jgi:hypothetical protein
MDTGVWFNFFVYGFFKGVVSDFEVVAVEVVEVFEVFVSKVEVFVSEVVSEDVSVSEVSFVSFVSFVSYVFIYRITFWNSRQT